MPHSHHSHSGQFCRHAAGTLEDVVRAAIRRGFETYALTEHVPRSRVEDLYPEELSAAAFRKGWDGAYPGPDVVEVSRSAASARAHGGADERFGAMRCGQVILQEGGRFVLSDDSHGPHAVGLNYHRIPEYARRVGIKELWVLERAQGSVRNAAGRAVVPRKVEGDWLEHPFWSRLEKDGQ
ncbi:hypothetical protein FKP32DRAFT_1600067 [Trametes sanguinea]|nr:hypothetical protein FKP32DRAFT_1600067 [Trametes sanguinea]